MSQSSPMAQSSSLLAQLEALPSIEVQMAARLHRLPQASSGDDEDESTHPGTHNLEVAAAPPPPKTESPTQRQRRLTNEAREKVRKMSVDRTRHISLIPPGPRAHPQRGERRMSTFAITGSARRRGNSSASHPRSSRTSATSSRGSYSRKSTSSQRKSGSSSIAALSPKHTASGAGGAGTSMSELLRFQQQWNQGLLQQAPPATALLAGLDEDQEVTADTDSDQETANTNATTTLTKEANHATRQQQQRPTGGKDGQKQQKQHTHETGNDKDAATAIMCSEETAMLSNNNKQAKAKGERSSQRKRESFMTRATEKDSAAHEIAGHHKKKMLQAQAAAAEAQEALAENNAKAIALSPEQLGAKVRARAAAAAAAQAGQASTDAAPGAAAATEEDELPARVCDYYMVFDIKEQGLNAVLRDTLAAHPNFSAVKQQQMAAQNGGVGEDDDGTESMHGSAASTAGTRSNVATSPGSPAVRDARRIRLHSTPSANSVRLARTFQEREAWVASVNERLGAGTDGGVVEHITVADRYPKHNLEGFPLDANWAAFAFPDEELLSCEYRPARVHYAVMTLADGALLFATFLRFDVPMHVVEDEEMVAAAIKRARSIRDAAAAAMEATKPKSNPFKSARASVTSRTDMGSRGVGADGKAKAAALTSISEAMNGEQHVGLHRAVSLPATWGDENADSSDVPPPLTKGSGSATSTTGSLWRKRDGGSNPISLFRSRCLCLVSHYPFFDTFRIALTQLYSIAKCGGRTAGSGVALEPFVVQLCSEVPLPVPGRAAVQFAVNDGIYARCQFPGVRAPNVSMVPLRRLFDLLSIDTVIKCMIAILTERRLLFNSMSYTNTVIVIQCLLQLFYPFQWWFACIPLLANNMLDAHMIPQPYILGVNRRVLKHLSPDLDIVVDIDFDHFSVKDPKGNPLAEPPAAELQHLWRRLRAACGAAASHADGVDCDMETQQSCNSVMAGEYVANARPLWSLDFDYEVYRAMQRLFADLLSGFRKFLFFVQETAFFNAQGFVETRTAKDPSCVLFFEQLVKSRAFDCFIEEELKPDAYHDFIATGIPLSKLDDILHREFVDVSVFRVPPPIEAAGVSADDARFLEPPGSPSSVPLRPLFPFSPTMLDVGAGSDSPGYLARTRGNHDGNGRVMSPILLAAGSPVTSGRDIRPSQLLRDAPFTKPLRPQYCNERRRFKLDRPRGLSIDSRSRRGARAARSMRGNSMSASSPEEKLRITMSKLFGSMSLGREEIEGVKRMLEQKPLRSAFAALIAQPTKQSSSDSLCLTRESFDALTSILRSMLDACARGKDYVNGVRVLSAGTVYYMPCHESVPGSAVQSSAGGSGGRRFIEDALQNHVLWKSIDFWKQSLHYAVRVHKRDHEAQVRTAATDVDVAQPLPAKDAHNEFVLQWMIRSAQQMLNFGLSGDVVSDALEELAKRYDMPEKNWKTVTQFVSNLVTALVEMQAHGPGSSAAAGRRSGSMSVSGGMGLGMDGLGDSGFGSGGRRGFDGMGGPSAPIDIGSRTPGPYGSGSGKGKRLHASQAFGHGSGVVQQQQEGGIPAPRSSLRGRRAKGRNRTQSHSFDVRRGENGGSAGAGAGGTPVRPKRRWLRKRAAET